jgi:hypothetical protein
MRAISSVNLLRNYIGTDQAKALVGILKEHPTLKSLCGNRGDETELNMSGKMKGAGDAIMLVPEVIDNGAISSANLLKNGIGINQAQTLASILKDHPTLKSLCGNKGNEVELDMSGKMNGAADAILLVPEITDNGALLSLSLKSNNLISHSDQGKAAGKALGEMLAVNTNLTELDLSSNGEYSDTSGVGFAQELAVGLKDNGALQCTDGTPYQSEKLFLMSTHVCRHCGQHKTQHTSR